MTRIIGSRLAVPATVVPGNVVLAYSADIKQFVAQRVTSARSGLPGPDGR
jgi:hypothetical protein